MTVQVLGRRFPAAATYTVALAASLVLLLLAVGSALVLTNQSERLNQHVLAAFEGRAHLRQLLRGLQDMETGQRGYLLTGDEDYLEPYFAAQDDIFRELDALAEAADTPARQSDVEQLRDLTLLKLQELTETVALRRAGRRNEAISIVSTDRGLQRMEAIREVIVAAEAREQERVYSSLRAVDQNGFQLRIIILIAVLLLIGIGALLVVAVRNAMAELRASRDALQESNERLVQEIGGREAAEERARQLQKMEAVGQLTGGIAHDFNNMLAVIISALQLAKRRLDRGEQDVTRFIDAAMDGARRAATLTARLLAFARRQPLEPAVVDVNKVLGGMSDMLRRTLGGHVELETVLAGGAWKVLIDVGELENAILNICVNARDAMPDGGKLTIESANAYLDDAYAAANADVQAGQYVMIAITDTGQGMDAQTMARAFDPFFTTKEVGKGTGLGLSHVHGFLKQSGGHVSLYSELGVGTTVKLYLPRTMMAESAAPQTLAATPEELPQGDAATVILLVEDEERVRTLAVASLRELGYTVLHADSGASALSLLEANEAVSLLFTDVVMPGMSGRKLADEALARRPDLKVLYTTGYTQNAIVHNGVLDADARLLHKPYSLPDLARKIRSVLDE